MNAKQSSRELLLKYHMFMAKLEQDRVTDANADKADHLDGIHARLDELADEQC